MQLNPNIQIKIIPLSEIKLNPKNRNKHSPEQIDRLCKIIKYQGFREPGIISNRSGFLVAGEGRYLASKKLGLEGMPCTMQDFDSDDQEHAFGISTNAIASWAELDLAGINTDLGDLGPDFEIDLLGIKSFLLEPAEKFINSDEHWSQLPEFEGPDAPLRIIIICKDEFSRTEFIEKFNLKIMKRLSGNLIWSLHWPQE